MIDEIYIEAMTAAAKSADPVKECAGWEIMCRNAWRERDAARELAAHAGVVLNGALEAKRDLILALGDAMRSLDSLSSEVFNHHTPLSGLIDPRKSSVYLAARATLNKAKGAS